MALSIVVMAAALVGLLSCEYDSGSVRSKSGFSVCYGRLVMFPFRVLGPNRLQTSLSEVPFALLHLAPPFVLSLSLFEISTRFFPKFPLATFVPVAIATTVAVPRSVQPPTIQSRPPNVEKEWGS